MAMVVFSHRPPFTVKYRGFGRSRWQTAILGPGLQGSFADVSSYSIALWQVGRQRKGHNGQGHSQRLSCDGSDLVHPSWPKHLARSLEIRSWKILTREQVLTKNTTRGLLSYQNLLFSIIQGLYQRNELPSLWWGSTEMYWDAIRQPGGQIGSSHAIAEISAQFGAYSPLKWTIEISEQRHFSRSAKWCNFPRASK